VTYRLGHIAFDITGDNDTARRLREILSLLETPDSDADLEFRFTESLEKIDRRSWFHRGRYWASPKRTRMLGPVWRYEIRCGESPVRVHVTPRRLGIPGRFFHVLRKSWRHVLTHGRGAYIHELKRFVYYVYMPLLELAMLRADSTFAHCGAVERDGGVTLFAAEGGVGKTSLVCRYVRKGWRFLSDDYCAIGRDGTVWLHPLPMHLYKFHEAHAEYFVNRMLAAATPWDRMLWRLLGKIRRPDRLVRWVNPEQILDREMLAREGKVTTVLCLRRLQECRHFALRPIEISQAAQIITRTVLEEIHELPPLCEAAQKNCSDEFIPGVTDLSEMIADVLAGAMAKARCFEVDVPAGAGSEAIGEFLEANGLLS
jgi:hypothetical protein